MLSSALSSFDAYIVDIAYGQRGSPLRARKHHRIREFLKGELAAV
jgi:hypothetical protein